MALPPTAPPPAALCLAFSLSRWTERRKAELWEGYLAEGVPPTQGPETRELERLDREMERHHQMARTRGAALVLPGDPGLDHLWSGLPYPLALWVQGTLPPATPTLAMVGSRQATSRGRTRARDWARQLTQAGVGILSGLARGIDAAAHEGALEVGPTWGVMGSGLDHPYPPEHRDLMARMVAGGGGVLTPFPPEAQPQKWHFPRRNVLLAAWTSGVLLVEGQVQSGSLVTARLALDLGRELWVCPGAPEDPSAAGPNALLREGAARVARSPEDLLEDLGHIPGLTTLRGLGPLSQSWSLT